MPWGTLLTAKVNRNGFINMQNLQNQYRILLTKSIWNGYNKVLEDLLKNHAFQQTCQLWSHQFFCMTMISVCLDTSVPLMELRQPKQNKRCQMSKSEGPLQQLSLAGTYYCLTGINDFQVETFLFICKKLASMPNTK